MALQPFNNCLQTLKTICTDHGDILSTSVIHFPLDISESSQSIRVPLQAMFRLLAILLLHVWGKITSEKSDDFVALPVKHKIISRFVCLFVAQKQSKHAQRELVYSRL